MTRQETLKTLSTLLPQQPQEKLEAILGWIKLDDDAFEAKLRTDTDSGKFDRLLAKVIAEDEKGETIDLETSCDQDVLETVS
jgi:hypothetical protein